MTIAHPDGETVELAKEAGSLTLRGLAANEEFDPEAPTASVELLSYSASTGWRTRRSRGGCWPCDRVVYRAKKRQGTNLRDPRVARRKAASDGMPRFAVTLTPAAEETVPENEDDAARTAREKRARIAPSSREHRELMTNSRPGSSGSPPAAPNNMTLRRAALVKEKAGGGEASGGSQPAVLKPSPARNQRPRRKPQLKQKPAEKTAAETKHAVEAKPAGKNQRPRRKPQ